MGSGEDRGGGPRFFTASRAEGASAYRPYPHVMAAREAAMGNIQGVNDGQALGRSRGGFGTKVHVAVDALGNPVRLIATAGQVADVTQAEALMDGLEVEHVIADKGYDSGKLAGAIEAAGAEAVIPPRSNRKQPRDYDEHLYK